MTIAKGCYTGGRLLLLNIALGLGTFIQILDTSIANVAVPYIAGNLSVSADQGTWVITSFACSNAVVLPLTGWLSDYFGRVKLFCVSVFLFTVMSLLCGLATSLPMLITFRVLQGAVAGCLIPLSQSLLLLSNPPDKQGSALGFWAMVVVVAPVLGPILGGYLTEVYSWPWIFYINVPIGLFSAWVTWTLLKDRESELKRVPIDWVGLFLLAVSVSTMQVMLDKGKDLNWFESNTIIALTLVSIITLAYFIVWNYYERYHIVDFSFFKDRNFLLGTLVTTMGYLIFFGSTVTVPLWLQTEQGYTAYWAGVAVAPIGIFPMIFSTYIGKNLHRCDLRMLAAGSFALFALGFFMQSVLTTEVNLSFVMYVRLVQGLGVMIFFVPLVQLSLGNIPREKYASASGLFNFIRILVGSGFGTSLSIELWSHMEIWHHSRITEQLTAYTPNVTNFYNELTQFPATPTNVVSRILDQMIEQQAYMLSTNDLSWLCAWIFVVMVPIPFLCKRVQKAPSTAAASAAH